MKKQYLCASLLLALSFGVTSLASAMETSVDTTVNGSVKTRPVRVETRMKLNVDFKAANDARKSQMQAQREKMKGQAETMRAAAQAKGDEFKAKREAMKVELETKRGEMDAKREAMKVEAESRRASSTAKRVEFQQNIAKRKVENTVRILNATIERLEKIIERIESRIAKIQDRGADTTESEKYVADAKANLSDAKVSVSAFVSIDLSSDKAQENFERIRTLAAEARELIRAARENLIMAIRSLGSIESTVEANATTTVEQN